MSVEANKDREANLESSGLRTAASHNRIKNVVAVMSGKGGVGKSFITALLVSGFSASGYKVGILDADYTGSSIPMLFGVNGPAATGQYGFSPLQSRSGIELISTNLLFEDENQAVIWKEALISNVIKELWLNVEWGALDYLLIDMPSAVSEAAVAILQSIPFTGAVIVTTPQQLCTKITNRVVCMVQGTGLPIIGIVENMSCFLDPIKGEKKFIFEQHHAETVARVAKSSILANIPFNPELATLCDLGRIEDVPGDVYNDLVDSFLASLSVIEQKRISEEIERQTHDEEKVDIADQDILEEAASDSLISDLQVNPGYQAFSDTVLYLAGSKANVGVLEKPDAQGYFLGKCGDRMQIELKLINGRILDAKFLADGCVATQACGTMITKMACTRTLEEAGFISSEELIEVLDGLPDDHLHCAELAVMTLQEAIIDAVEGHRQIK